jgi:pyruvate,water dikinase
VEASGGKNASLGEMWRELSPKGVRLADGFAVTAQAYHYFLRESGIDRRIRAILADLDTRHLANLQARAREVRHAIVAGELPPDLQEEIVAAYDEVCGKHVSASSRSTSRRAPAPRRRTYRMPASPASKRPT